MNVNPLFNSGSSTTGALDTTPAPKVLSQDDFLKLLVTQMTTQDPLNPTKDTDFIAQMAQFSSLEQAKTMQSDISALRSDQQMSQAASLIGRNVTLDLDGNTQISGQVSAVQVVAGTPMIVVNGKGYDLAYLSAISPAPASN